MPKARPFKSLIGYEKAYSIVMDNVKGICRTEDITILEAAGRIAAADVIAELPLPPFNRSGMDGFAVTAKDTYEATRLKSRRMRLIGRIYAGSPPLKRKLRTGEVIAIATGAELPTGADAVIPIEDTETSGSVVNLHRGVHPNENVSKTGSDIQAGTVVVKKGIVLDSKRIGVIAAIGRNTVKAFERPRVAVIPTGTEIAEPGGRLERGKVYDSNSRALAVLAKENGCDPVIFNIVPDEGKALAETVEEAMKSDMIIVSGGSSVGERDLIVDIVRDKGNLLFHGVQIKPGKPFLCGKVGEKIVFGMPGYPAAFIMVAYVFILPALRKLANLPPRELRTVKAILDTKLATTLGRRQFVTVRLERGRAIPVFKESGAISSLSEADGYIEIPENVDIVEKDEEVDVRLFSDSSVFEGMRVGVSGELTQNADGNRNQAKSPDKVRT